MPELSPDSEATLHITEAGLQLAINAYQRARPEELRLVSAHYPDGDRATIPLSLNDDGVWLDYALRISSIVIDMAPADPALHSPVPPEIGQFQITAKISIEFRNFADPAATFAFDVQVWIRCRPLFFTAAGSDEAFVKIELKDGDLRVKGMGPDVLTSFIEHIMTLIVRQALSRMQFPTTFNIEEFLKVLMLDLDVKQDTVQVYGAVHRRPGE